MTKLSKKALLILLALTLVLTLSLAACKNDATVTFVGGEGATGTAPNAIQAQIGTSVVMPANTFTKQGYKFAGWKYGDKVLQPNELYLVESASVEFVAQWTEEQPVIETWTVTFKNGTDTVKSVEVVKGQKLTAEQIPAAPTVGEDKEFKGWFEGNNEITIDTVINGNITAVAKIVDKVLIENVAITYKAGEGTGEDVVINKSKGMAFNLATASEIGTAFTAPANKMLTGWKLQGDSSSKVYALGEEYTAQAAATFIAQWGNAQIVAVDQNYVAVLLLDIGADTGVLEISNENDQISHVSLTYTLTDTTLVVTIGESSYTGTLDGQNINITIAYQGKNYVFATEPAPSGAPTVTFNANGGTGTAPQIGELTADNIGYKLVLPENTFTAPAGKEFKEWNVVVDNGKDTPRKVGEYIYLYAGEEVVVKAVWQDAEVPSIHEPVTFVGSCTVPTKTSFLGTQGGQTYVKFVVDVDALKVTYYISTGDSKQVTAADDSSSNWKPDKYGEGSIYVSLNMEDNIGYYLLIKADLSELTLCDSDDEPITNGVFTAQSTEQPTTVTVTFVVGQDAGITAPAAQTIEYNATATEPAAADMAREGYRFDGWKVGSLTGESYDFTTPVTANITLYAKWSKAYAVTYAKPDGAEGEVPTSVTVYEGEQHTLIANPFTMEGYNFLGWKVGSNSQTKVAGANVNVTDDTTITAVFSKVYANVEDSSYTITLRTDGIALMDGYPYDYTEEDGTIQIDFGYGMYLYIEVNANGTFVQLDDLVNYEFTSNNGAKLSFDGKGGAKLDTIDGTYTIIWGGDDYYGYYIDGFNLTIGDKTYENIIIEADDDFQLVINVKISITGTDYIFGNPPAEYTITFEIGEDVTGTAPEELKALSTAGATLPSGEGLTKSGYKFVGWTEKDGDGTILNGKIEVSGNMTLVPVWKTLYTLTYEAGVGATGEMAAVELAESEELTLPKATFTAPADKKFAGWTDGDKTYKAGIKYTMPAQNVTLTAVWEEDGGSDPVNEPWGKITTAESDSLRQLCPDSTTNGVRLYFEEPVTIGGRTFLGVEIIYNKNFTWNGTSGAYRLKVVYSDSGEQASGAMTVENTSDWSEDDQKNLDANVLLFKNSAYRVVFGKKGDDFYIAEFKYSTNDVDTTLRKVAVKTAD